MSVHVGLNSLTLLQWGTEEQKQRFLVPQARGEKLATFGLTEPGVGTDAATSRPPPAATATPTCSTAEDLDLAWPTSPTTSWSSPRSTGARSTRASPPSSLERGMAGLHHRHASTASWACTPATPADQLRRRARAGREPGRRRGRGLHDRHERHRPGPLHGRDRRGRPRPGLPGRQSATPTSAQTFGAGDRPAPAGQADDRQDGAGIETGRLLSARRPG